MVRTCEPLQAARSGSQSDNEEKKLAGASRSSQQRAFGPELYRGDDFISWPIVLLVNPCGKALKKSLR